MLTPFKVCVLDDVLEAVRFLERALSRCGYEVASTTSPDRILSLLHDFTPDILLLDLHMPGTSGLRVLDAIRSSERFSTLPVIFVTGTHDEAVIIQALQKADDYVIKPFKIGELEARIQAVLRRAGIPGRRYQDSEISIDVRGRKLLVMGREEKLTTHQWLALGALLSAGKPVSRAQLADEVWGKGRQLSARAVDVLVYKLRQKLDCDPNRPALIRTVRNEGYQFMGAEPPVAG